MNGKISRFQNRGTCKDIVVALSYISVKLLEIESIKITVVFLNLKY
jgi:hypothetical protein